MSKEKDSKEKEGLLHSPEVTGEITPVESPEDVGHLSGGEVQQHLSRKNLKKGAKNGK